MKTIAIAATLVSLIFSAFASEQNADKRYLYVAVPGIRNYLEFGGHGLRVFDIVNNHKVVNRIPTAGVD